MKRLIIVCEGETEQAFCNDVLHSHFLSKDIVLEAPTIKHSNGGIVAWDTLKKQIVKHLNEGNCMVSMFVDYYRIRDSYHFPGWMEAKGKLNLYDRMHYLFEQMSQDMDEKLRPRFVPYIQLHEFEGLLFSDISVFPDNFTKEQLDYKQLESAVSEFSTPEEINNSPATAPSERLKKAVSGYDKVTDGAFLAMEIGLDTIREKCILFNEWMGRLENS